MDLVSGRVAKYFRLKRQQLLTSAQMAICDHHGLAGSHREELQRIYLNEILPRRYAVGRGMIYGIHHRSHECDVVIWDDHNFPSLPMSDHRFFFSESARMALESKSRWSPDDFQDVLKKAKAVRDIVPEPRQTLDDELSFLQLEVLAMKQGVPHYGMMRSSPHIATAALFLAGGNKALRSSDDLDDETLEIDDCWPDIVLLLEPGRVILKQYEHPDDGNYGRLLFFELGEDSLFVFTSAVLQLLADRSVLTDGPFFLDRYGIGTIAAQPYDVKPFRLHRFPPGRMPLWG